MQLFGRELGEVLGSNRQSRPKLVNEGSALQKGGVGKEGDRGADSWRCSWAAVDWSNSRLPDRMT
jgi:hypothetical protein